jgi:hypothetical protein
LSPVLYFHLVFAVPAPIAGIALQNKAVIYDILFRAAVETVQTIAVDPKHLGAVIGADTRGQNLFNHGPQARSPARPADPADRRIAAELVDGTSGHGIASDARRRAGVAVTIVAKVGDFRHFANARQLMAYLGLGRPSTPPVAASGPAGITKDGNVLARRLLIEGAWTTAWRHGAAEGSASATRGCPRRSATLLRKLNYGSAFVIDGSPWPGRRGYRHHRHRSLDGRSSRPSRKLTNFRRDTVSYLG